MTRTILIPTDFTVDSLVAVKKILESEDGGRTKIVLFHGIFLSGSITDLLMFSKSKCLRRLADQSYRDACEIIRNKFSSHLHSLHTELFTGHTAAAFRNFVEGNGADAIGLIDHFTYGRPSPQSMDVSGFIPDAGVPVIRVVAELPASTHGKNRLAALFSETT